MTTKIPPRIWEDLSSYLDGQLTLKERARLESQLESNPDLRSALEDLRRTRAVLRSQRMLRAPRNFTLSPEMAGIREGVRPYPNAYPVLRLASVMATIFFLVMFVGDLATRSIQPVPLLGMKEAQVSAPVQGFGGGGGGGGPAMNVPPPEAAPALAMEMTATPESTGKMFGNAPGTAEGERLMVTPLAASVMATPAPQAELSADQILSPTVEAIQPKQPPDVQAVALAEETAPTSPVITSQTILRLLQILLALLAIGTALAALFLRRSTRS